MKADFLRLVLITLLLGAAAPTLAQSPPPARPPAVLTPVQAAFLQAEARRIEDAFVQKVMGISGASRSQVVRAIPAKGRLTDRLSRIYSSLERDLGAPLADEQKAMIFVAEGERKQALKELPALAATK
ncbi:MAG: hypothetical protein PHD22_06715 [Zoogloea sp.]|nr:hypothetical protein [Zoogloea sp.]